jgi:hypothetical protein
MSSTWLYLVSNVHNPLSEPLTMQTEAKSDYEWQAVTDEMEVDVKQRLTEVNGVN